MEAFGKFCLTLISIILITIYSGFVFMKFWEWFIVFAFQFKALTLIQAIGVKATVEISTKLKYKKESDKYEDELKEFIKKIIILSLVLLFGYIITLFQ